MTNRVARLHRVIDAVALIVPRRGRDAWREEWCAELWCAPHVNGFDVIRGALIDALLLRVGAPDEWHDAISAAVRLLLREPLGVGAAVWIGGTWFVMSVLLATLGASAIVGHRAPGPRPEMVTLIGVAGLVLIGVSWAALRALRGVLIRVAVLRGERQRAVIAASVATPALLLGGWLTVLSFRILDARFAGAPGAALVPSSAAMSGPAAAIAISAACAVVVAVRISLRRHSPDSLGS